MGSVLGLAITACMNRSTLWLPSSSDRSRPRRLPTIKQRFSCLSRSAVLVVVAGWMVSLTLASAASAASAEAVESDLDGRASARAEELFSGGAGGGMVVEAAYVLSHVAAGGLGGTLQLLVEGPFGPLDGSGGSRMRLSLVVQGGDEPELIAHREVVATSPAGTSPAGTSLSRARAWLYETPLAVQEEARELVVVIEELATGRWGAAVVEWVDEPFELPREGIARTKATRTWSLRPPSATTSGGSAAGGGGGGKAGGAPTPVSSSAVRILPPEGRRLLGETLIETLVGDPRVTKVEIYLDDQRVATPQEPPFDATVQLLGPGHEQRVRAVAFTGDRPLGEDSIVLNRPPPVPFRVRIQELKGDPASGSLEVRVKLSVPRGSEVEKVEYWFNDQLAASRQGEPFTARVATPDAGPNDFIRVVATLRDGRSLEDVALLSARGVSDELDVTLVELFVFATGRDGRPVRDLTESDFIVRQNGKRQSLARVAFASEVPLVLGLVVDTSGSMELMMGETKRAASGFLQDTVTEIDQAFVVDFDTLPRLRQGTTGDLMQLYGAFRQMVAGGYTALYDAILFALAEFEEGPGRRALVLLTDGDDYKSRFGVNRCVRAARALGVPVYIIGLGDPSQVRGFTRLGLEAVTEKTGGRLYFVQEVEELAGVYSEINQELRAQYLVTYYADSTTAGQPRDDVQVKIGRRGVKARAVISPAGQ